MTKRKLSILIVDDNVPFVNRMISLINETKSGNIINSAHTYDDAASLVNSTTDLVLLDINLGGRNGLGLLKEIRESDNACKVVMVSNHSSEYYREQCEKLGATTFLDKTNEFEQVPMILERMYHE